jgi:hypothetical protein
VLKKTRLARLFSENVHDPRRPKCNYSATSLLLITTLMHILRFQSRNAFHNQAVLPGNFVENVAKLADSKGIPSPKTFEDFFIQLDYHDLEPILPALFRWLLRSKFFKLHPEFKGDVPENDTFQLAIDGEVTHKYTDCSQHPCASCPYCLKRTRGETVWYIHSEIVLSIIGESSFQIPLFVYRIKKEQQLENCSEEKLKQECELTALPFLLEQFRKEFPRLPVNLLLDSLYAQGPAMQTAEKYHCGFTIVRKEGSLKSLNDDIEGLKQLVKPIKRKLIKGRWQKEQQAYIFLDMSHQGHSFTVIDFIEKCNKVGSSRFAKKIEKTTHWQWITSQAVSTQKVFKIIQQSRLRWHQEDFFNTVEHRGYNLLHDFSRNFLSQSVWRLLMFIAFTISMFMELSKLGVLLRQSAAIVNWIENLRAFFIAGDINFDEPLPGQLRFSSDTS